jgi:hypothetical protein
MTMKVYGRRSASLTMPITAESSPPRDHAAQTAYWAKYSFGAWRARRPGMKSVLTDNPAARHSTRR